MGQECVSWELPGPRPDRTLAERELVNSLGWLIRMRWLAGLAVLAATGFATGVLGVRLPAPELYAVGLAILCYNAVLRWALGWIDRNLPSSQFAYQWFARAQIGLDWIAMAVLINLSGGIESPALVFFLFHITIASLLLPHRRGFLDVALAPLLVGGVAVLMCRGTLPHIDQEVLSGRTVLVPDAWRDPRIRYPEEAREEGIRTMLSAPLIVRSGAIGVLRAYGGEGHRFTKEDAAFLSAVAGHGAVAIENAEAYQLLQNLNWDKSRFVLTVTHELRSPIQVAQSLLSVLTRGYVGPLAAEQADLVGRALKRTQFLQTLVDDLLALAAGRGDALVSAERRPISLADLVRDVCARFEVPARDRGLRFRQEYAAAPLFVWGDPGELDRMLNHLVSNAIKYTPRGEVRVLVEAERDSARLVVADTGIGIPAEARAHLFEEFFRAGNAKALEESGTGLGLAIVKDLVERYGGTIDVESAEGQGTTFTVRLPLVAQPSAAERDG